MCILMNPLLPQNRSCKTVARLAHPINYYIIGNGCAYFTCIITFPNQKYFKLLSFLKLKDAQANQPQPQLHGVKDVSCTHPLLLARTRRLHPAVLEGGGQYVQYIFFTTDKEDKKIIIFFPPSLVGTRHHVNQSRNLHFCLPAHHFAMVHVAIQVLTQIECILLNPVVLSFPLTFQNYPPFQKKR